MPYHHANVDSDEVLFYSDGDFMSRAGSGIGVGSISLHPAGFVHGPQPGSRERSESQDRTSELAVMLDTFAPLGLSDAARDVSDPDYPWSWAGGSVTDRPAPATSVRTRAPRPGVSAELERADGSEWFGSDQRERPVEAQQASPTLVRCARRRDDRDMDRVRVCGRHDTAHRAGTDDDVGADPDDGSGAYGGSNHCSPNDH